MDEEYLFWDNLALMKQIEIAQESEVAFPVRQNHLAEMAVPASSSIKLAVRR